MHLVRHPDPGVRPESSDRRVLQECALDAEATPGPLLAALWRPRDGRIVVRLQGELDMLTVPRSRRVLTGAVDAIASEMARPPVGRQPLRGTVVCDLGQLHFVAASGLGMLVEVAAHARTRSVELVLAPTSRPVRRALHLTGLDRHFLATPGP